jgi:hypothetical protein
MTAQPPTLRQPLRVKTLRASHLLSRSTSQTQQSNTRISSLPGRDPRTGSQIASSLHLPDAEFKPTDRYQLGFQPTQKVRSSRPSRPLFRISVANRKEPLLTDVLVALVVPGLAWCGVLARLNDSARKRSSNRSVRRNLRSRPASTLPSAGPRRVILPARAEADRGRRAEIGLVVPLINVAQFPGRN